MSNPSPEHGPLLTDPAFFALLRGDIERLAPTRAAAARGDFSEAKARLLEAMRARERPVWTFDWRELDEHRDPDFDTAEADRICRHTFGWFKRSANLGPDIDWTANGFEPDEPAYTPEWTYDLNRFFFWQELGRAYWATGEERYAEEFVAQMLDWVHDQPAPVDGHPNTAPCWRTIEQGIRTAGPWMDAYYYFLGSPAMTPEAHCTFLKSFVEHARTLTRMTVEHPEHRGNWVTMECNGLAHIGVMFPEFEEAAHWRTVAYDRLMEELDRQVYPDGAQKELTTGYHQVARRNFYQAVQPARRNDVPVPEGYMERLKGLYRYNLACISPDGFLPPLNDSHRVAVRDTLREAYEIWGDPEFLWGATGGVQGEALDAVSHFFPWAGQAVMRGGWNPDDAYLMFEIGPFGIGHQHEDKLGLYLSAYGIPLLTEAGTYTYDHSKWRRYVLSTAAHNTIRVDGLGQHRRGLEETYARETPMAGCWATGDLVDWATGMYAKGYGPRLDPDGEPMDREHDLTEVRHERTVVFVRPDAVVVIDRVLGEGAHTAGNLFHLDAQRAVFDDESLVVRSCEPDRPNLTLIPLATEGLSLRMVKGQEDPVQGWIPTEDHRSVREAPTAVYEKRGALPQTFVTVLVPHPDEAPPPHTVQLLTLNDEFVALRVETGDREDVVLYAFDGPAAMQAAAVRAVARLAVVRTTSDGRAEAELLDGSELTVAGRPLASRALTKQ